MRRGGDRVRSELLWGLHSCSAAIAAQARVIKRAWLDGEDGARASLAAALRAHGIPVARATRETLQDLVSRGTGGSIQATGDQTQGIVVEVVPLHVPPAPDASSVPWPGARAAGSSSVPHLVIALDGISDPHNVGAVLRSALLLSADGVLLSAAGCAPLNGTVSRTSAGALELLAAAGALRVAAALPASLGAYRRAGWLVLGTDASGGIEAAALARRRNTVLVLGSEGSGMRPGVRAACEALVAIPTAGGRGLVDSLNVSNAAAVLLWQLRPAGIGGGGGSGANASG